MISARLSSIEAKIAALGVGKHGVKARVENEVKTKTAEVPESPKAEDAPRTEVVKNSEAEKRPKGQRINGWSEILSLYRENNSSSAPFLESAEVTIDDNSNVEILVESPIAKMMLEVDGAAGLIENLISSKGIIVDRVNISVKAAKEQAETQEVF